MEEGGRKLDVVAWLAAATGDDSARVAAELDLGERRRAFVFHELAEAGFTGRPLVEFLTHLTGIDEQQARAMIAEHERRTAVPRRDARLAQNEIRFRRHNEEFARLGVHGSPRLEIDLVCECSDSGCTSALTMPFAEYEQLRSDPHRFAVLPGHEAPAVEDAVERHEAYVIIEKHAATHRLVEAADPRA